RVAPGIGTASQGLTALAGQLETAGAFRQRQWLPRHHRLLDYADSAPAGLRVREIDAFQHQFTVLVEQLEAEGLAFAETDEARLRFLAGLALGAVIATNGEQRGDADRHAQRGHQRNRQRACLAATEAQDLLDLARL